MMDSTDRALHEPRPRGPRRIRLLRNLLLATLLAVIVATVIGGVSLAAISRLPVYEETSRADLSHAIQQVALDLIGEQPHLRPNPPDDVLPLCENVDGVLVKPFRLAFGLMRATDEGLRLFNLLVEHSVCVDISEIAFNAAYAESRGTFAGDWSGSRIVVDRDLVRSGGADVLAAILVHESTHIDRAISGEACFIDDSCERLPNGVEVDEEVAAHAAEAEWWIAAFGADGKRLAMRVDYGENRLVRAYLRGADSFRAYVSRYRSDPREGDDF